MLGLLKQFTWQAFYIVELVERDIGGPAATLGKE